MYETLARLHREGLTILRDLAARDVANLVGYCQARDGHKLAFAFLMSSVFNTDVTHKIEANMAVTLAKYNG